MNENSEKNRTEGGRSLKRGEILQIPSDLSRELGHLLAHLLYTRHHARKFTCELLLWPPSPVSGDGGAVLGTQLFVPLASTLVCLLPMWWPLTGPLCFLFSDSSSVQTFLCLAQAQPGGSPVMRAASPLHLPSYPSGNLPASQLGS